MSVGRLHHDGWAEWEPCENCGTPVAVDELIDAIPTAPPTSSRVQTSFGPMTCTTRTVEPNPGVYEVQTASFSASDGGTADEAILTAHTPVRCRSARTRRQETR